MVQLILSGLHAEKGAHPLRVPCLSGQQLIARIAWSVGRKLEGWLSEPSCASCGISLIHNSRQTASHSNVNLSVLSQLCSQVYYRIKPEALWMLSGDRCVLKHPINATYLAIEALMGRRRSSFFKVGGANSPSCVSASTSHRTIC